jgi:hypothetical protein
MIKELVIGLSYITIVTVIIYPISTLLADAMQTIIGTDLLSLIMVSIVRYFGFFIGVGTIIWIYKGLYLQQQAQYSGGY